MRLGSNSFSLALGAGRGGDALSRALLSIFRRPGVEAHAYIPGIGTIGGLALQNFIESNGTVAAVVDSPLGYVGDASGDTPVINATQATTANKPILRRGAVNRLLNSATLSTQTRAVNALPYTLHFTGTGTVTLSGASTAGPLVGTGVSNRVSLTFTPTAGNLTLTVTGTVTDAQLETGSTANPYVPTTTEAASASTGPFWAEYDGTDFLSLAAVPFQQADDHCVVACVQVQSLAATRHVFSASGAETPRVCNINILTTGVPQAIWRDDAGTIVSITGGARPVATTMVLTGVKVGNARRLRVNGLQEGSTNTTALGTTTPAANGVIGAYLTGGFGQFLGGIFGVIALKGTFSDTDTAIIERWVAQQSGVTL